MLSWPISCAGAVALAVAGAAAVAPAARSLVPTASMVRQDGQPPGEQDVFIPADGFSLAATVTLPAGAAPSAGFPAVVLVGGANSAGRDELTSGVPIFRQLAGRLAAAGWLTVRYDKRGIGRSGGRVESAALSDYVDDLDRVVKWARDRRDVDGDRVVLLGYAEGGATAMLEAGRTDHVRALVLVAVPGVTGREAILREQAHELARLNEPAATKRAKAEFEQKMVDAVLTGTGWDALPPGLRARADTPWFKSWLLFDPVQALAKVSQPVLVVQGALDMQSLPESANRLNAAAAARHRPPSYTAEVVVPGVNHLLVPAATGEVDEYGALAAHEVSPAISSAIVDWLDATARHPPTDDIGQANHKSQMANRK